MDPLSIGGTILASTISGGLSYLGGQSANSANASQNMLADEINVTEAQMGRDFNADQAAQGRSFADTEMKAQDAFNASEAQKQRDYETTMSNTAYQRATADMKAAGINPMLAYMQGGASTPSGATASGGNPSAPTASAGIASAVSPARMADVMSPAISNAMQGAELAAKIANINADTQNKNAGPSGTIPAVRKVWTDMGGPNLGSVASDVRDNIPSWIKAAPGQGVGGVDSDSMSNLGKSVKDTYGTLSDYVDQYWNAAQNAWSKIVSQPSAPSTAKQADSLQSRDNTSSVNGIDLDALRRLGEQRLNDGTY